MLTLRDDKTGYDYIFIYVDGSNIAAKDPTQWTDRISSFF